MQRGKQTIIIHILPNTSRSKSILTMKFGQLIEYNMRNIFLEKFYAKLDGETVPRPFSKKSKLSIFFDEQSKVLYSLFLLNPNWALSKYIQTKLQTTCFYHIKGFLKNKKRFGTSLPAPFYEWVLKEIFYINLFILYWQTKLYSLIGFTTLQQIFWN